jgi:hypothetical protein
MRSAGLALLALCLVPSAATACGACVDHGVRINAPYAAPLYGLFLLWLLLAPLQRLLPWQRRLPPEARRPSRRTLRLLLALAFPGALALSLTFFMGALLASGGIVAAVWLLFLAGSLAARPWRRAADDGARTAWRRSAWLDAGFVALALLVVWRGVSASRPTEELIALTGYPVGSVYSTVIPEIVSRGSQAVEPLIAAARRSDAGEERQSATYFSLGRICDTRAETFLLETLRSFSRTATDPSERSARAAVFAAARCAGDRAVDDLTALHERSGSEDAWLALAALVHGGSRRGVLYALDNVEGLLEKARRGSPEGKIASATLTALATGKGAPDLQRIPVMRRVYRVDGSPLVDRDEGDLSAEFYWTRANEAADTRDAEALERLWQSSGAELRRRWEQTLAATPSRPEPGSGA